MKIDKTREIYQQIHDLNPNCENAVFTVIDGNCIGEKAICSNRKPVWVTSEDGFFRAREDIFGEIQDTGVRDAGGTRVYAERIGHEKKLIICGAGHVSMPVISIGLMTGFAVTVLEDRPYFAANAREAGAEVICDSFENGLMQVNGDEDTYFVIVTRGHRWDRECLRLIAEKPHAYVGLMGSRGRVRIVRENLKEEGFDAAFLEEVHAPIGLPIGGETPEEIAVSIMAEIIEVKNKRPRTYGYSKEMLGVILGIHHREIYDKKMVMTTIISRRGSAPRDVGTKMLILQDGTCLGTIGGGCMEAEVIGEGRRMMRNGDSRAKVFRVDLTVEAAMDEGMVCGGTIEVLMEPIGGLRSE